MKQTAVEWLEDKIKLSLGDEFKYVIGFFELSKEMEKEQIVKAFDSGLITENIYHGYDDKKAERYYDKTFKSE